MITVKDVVYDYPTARALHGVSFTVEAGAVLALVGPNGAGKTTLMRCIAALDVPTEGVIAVAGLDTQDDPRGVHAAIGYLPDFFGLYDELSVRRALTYAARSRGVPEADTPRAVTEAAARVQLSDRLESRAGELSRGLRQRLAIAQTIVHNPRALLLDEPAAGLDPEARRSLSDLILGLSREGMTIVVSSHILAELEEYATKMLMIRDGRVAGDGVVAADGGQLDARRIAITFDRPPRGLRKQLEAMSFDIERLGGAEAVIVLRPGITEADLLTALVQAGLKVSAFTPIRRSLADTYLAEARSPGETTR
jgi:ABC-2 type transport system ATP-binding protein